MAIWLIRAGSHGEYEQKFFQENRVYVTWECLDVNITKLKDRDALKAALAQRSPDAKQRTVSNWASQIWPFVHEIKKGDLVVVPLKTQPAIQIGEVTGDYQFNPDGPDPFFHWREVEWIGEAIPRSHFGQDLLYTFGAFMTICRIQRNSAEKRILAMKSSGWKPERLSSVKKTTIGVDVDQDTEDADLEEQAHDQIAKLINARFKGHKLTQLVEAILKAQGYTTYLSPEGPDGGVDILAGAGPLGFGQPQLCVEVKSGDTPIDRASVDKLIGAVTKFNAHQGLFVSWGGFKTNVQKELAPSFFRMRLWTQKELFEALFANYDRLDDEIKAELPLKRIWTVAAQEE